MNKVLLDNYRGENESFVYFLHEMSEFNEVAFWEYCNSLVELTKFTQDNNEINREMLNMVCHTYDYILRSFMWHFHPKDTYSIANLPIDDFPLYIERLVFSFNGFINGEIYDENIFELNNPMRKE